jgi:hypothetical protein
MTGQTTPAPRPSWLLESRSCTTIVLSRMVSMLCRISGIRWDSHVVPWLLFDRPGVVAQRCARKKGVGLIIYSSDGSKSS